MNPLNTTYTESRYKLTVSIFISLVLGCASLIALVLNIVIHEDASQWVINVLILSVIVSCVYSYHMYNSLRAKVNSISVRDEGFQCILYKYNSGIIPWIKIKNVEINPKYICLELYEEQDYINSLPSIDQSWMLSNIMMGKRAMYIPSKMYSLDTLRSLEIQIQSKMKKEV